MNNTQQLIAILLAVLTWVADRWFTHRKIEANQQKQQEALRRAYLMQIAPMAWAKVEAWKREVQADPKQPNPTPEIIQDRFFREMNDVLIASKRPLIENGERTEWVAWATLKTDSEIAVAKITGKVPNMNGHGDGDKTPPDGIKA